MEVLNSSNYDYTNVTEEEYEFATERPEAFIVPTVFFVIFIVGALGNGMLIFIFLKHKTLRNFPYNTYIFLMAIADLLVIMFCLPFVSILYTMSWPWGVAICKFSQTTETISMGVSAFTLMALTVERYYAVVKPLSASRYVKVKTVTTIVAWGIWILATCLSLEDAIHSRVNTVEMFDNEIMAYCTPIPNITSEWTKKKYYLQKFLIYFGIPLCIISYFYVLIAIRLHDNASETSRRESQVRNDRNVTKMVLILVFFFFICSLPSHVFYLWFHLDPLSEEKYNVTWHVIRTGSFCLSFLRCCVNPMVLCCCSDLFRTCFKRYFCCRGLEASQLLEEMHLA